MSARNWIRSPRRWDLSVRGQRGITLIEVVVVGVLATVVMLALTGFYINSQGTWIDASSQAVTQRELSLVLATIADSVHVANSATGSTGTGALILNVGAVERCRFWVGGTDSLMHIGQGPSTDWGPIGTSKVTEFNFDCNATRVKIHSLQMRSAGGSLVRMSTLLSFYNR